MEWEKAKNILIVALVVLNAGLFAFSLLSSQKYTLPKSDIENITSVLEQNGLKLECDLPADFSPMKAANVTQLEWDFEYLQRAFFKGQKDVTRTVESGNIVYSKDGTRAIVSDRENILQRNELTVIEEIDNSRGTDSEKIAESYRQKLGERAAGFKLFRAVDNGAFETFIYNETIEGKPLYNSQLRIIVKNTEADRAEVTLFAKIYRFTGFQEGEKSIFKSPEAALTFMHYAANRVDVTITNMDIGYYIDDISKDLTNRAKPCYRIFIKDSEAPVYIDAVTNVIL